MKIVFLVFVSLCVNLPINGLGTTQDRYKNVQEIEMQEKAPAGENKNKEFKTTKKPNIKVEIVSLSNWNYGNCMDCMCDPTCRCLHYGQDKANDCVYSCTGSSLLQVVSACFGCFLACVINH